ncbi:protein ALP1-like, partial [Etheostoma cragini]|uniref:protein ALP1-like n=1 Tax=Etheostoma cragini TaxID=417921 RepID=UPI00155DF8E4
MRVDFRLSRRSFHGLMAILGTACDHGWGPVIESLVFLFWLASASSYRVVVRLPTEDDLPEIGAGFARLAGSAAFHRVVGSIDGCHVRVTPPVEDAACYLNRNIFYSVQLQAVCDHTAKFIDVFVGFPGSAHDARVLKHSPLYYQKRYPPPGFCLIGDGGYPCLRQPITLMTPFRQPVQNNLQVRFNAHLSRARSVVERAFGILKTRWRSIFLKALEVDVLYVPEVIACCTVLHNICLTNGDLLEPEAYAEGEAEDHPQPALQGAICGAED